MRQLQFIVVVEKDADSDWGAWVPDLPGCVATAKSIDVVLRRIEGAIRFHLEGMAMEGEPLPRPKQRSFRPRKTAKHIEFFATVRVAA